MISDDIHTTLPPISSDFGLPPSLVPINSFAFGNLAPYPYHSYPINAYDQFGGFGGYLPPYPFYPPGFDGSDKGKKDSGKDEEKDEKKDDSSSADDGKGENDDKSSGSSSNGSSGGGSSSGGGGSSGGSNSSGGGSSGGASSSGGSSGGSSSSTSTKSSRLQNFDKPEFLQQQSLNDNIKNFPNKDPTIPDIDPSPPVRVKPLSK